MEAEPWILAAQQEHPQFRGQRREEVLEAPQRLG